MTPTRSQKLRLGIFTAAATGALAVVLVVFAGLKFWERRDHYTVYFDDSVMGLEEGAPVSFSGIKVGTVDSIGVDPGDLRRVKVVIEVRAGLPIRTDTTATLQYAGITGLKVIDLHGGDVRAARLAPGGVIATGQSAIDRFQHQADALLAQSQQIMESANRVIDNLATVTDPAQFAGVAEIIAHARVASGNLAAISGDLREMLGENRGAMKRAVASIDRVTGEAGGLVGDLRAMVRANAGTLRTTLFDLRQASRSMKELARDLKRKPSRLLFSDAAGDRRLP